MEEIYELNANYQIRTVTMTYTGKLIQVGTYELVLTNAAWIADTGRFMQATASGKYNEVEPYPPQKRVIIGRGAIVDAVTIPILPSVQK